MATIAGYTPEQAKEATAAWRALYPHLAETGSDGAVIVSDAAVCAFFTYLDMMGLSAVDTLRASYDAETGKVWLALTAHLPYAEWRQVAQQSALADALPDPAGAVN